MTGCAAFLLTHGSKTQIQQDWENINDDLIFFCLDFKIVYMHFALFWLDTIQFAYILQGHLTATVTILELPQYESSRPEEYC